MERIANGMHLLAILAMLCLIPLRSAMADQEVAQTLPAQPAGMVRVHNPRGDVSIQGWNKEEVHVMGALDDLARNLVFDVDGALTVVRVDLPRKNARWGDGSDLEIFVPVESSLKIDGLSSNVEIEGVRGAIAARTVSGDVDVRGSAGQVRIKTVSGDVEVEESSGRLVITTTSGDVDIEAEVGDVFIDTMSGDADIRLGQFDRLVVNSVNGALHLAGTLNGPARVSARTVNADIELALAPPINARIVAVALANGNIDNDLTGDQPRRGEQGRLVLETVVGDGSAEVMLTTVNGTIEVE